MSELTGKTVSSRRSSPFPATGPTPPVSTTVTVLPGENPFTALHLRNNVA